MKLLRIILILFFLVVAVFPVLFLLSASFKGAEEIFSIPPSLLPENFNTENYSGLITHVPFLRYFLNSAIVVIVSVISNLFISSLAGFALARLHFRGKKLFFLLVLASLLVPKEIVIIPLYSIILQLNLSDTLAGVLLPFLTDAMTIYMMKEAFSAIPVEIEEAALMDGISISGLWWRVMMPMTLPTMGVAAVFTFVGTWGDFLWPLVVLKSPENYTIQLGINNLLGTFVSNYRYVAAGSVLALIPILIVFLFTQKYFIAGIFAGSRK